VGRQARRNVAAHLSEPCSRVERERMVLGAVRWAVALHVAAAAAAVAPASAVAATVTGPPSWPMPRRDAGNTGGVGPGGLLHTDGVCVCPFAADTVFPSRDGRRGCGWAHLAALHGFFPTLVRGGGWGSVAWAVGRARAPPSPSRASEQASRLALGTHAAVQRRTPRVQQPRPALPQPVGAGRLAGALVCIQPLGGARTATTDRWRGGALGW
jgi:hypothetical protein